MPGDPLALFPACRLLLLMLLGLLESIGFALDGDNLRVVYQPIHQGDHAGDVGKDLTPLLEGAIGRDEGRALFIASGDDFEQQVGVTVGVGEIADFIN